MGKTAAGRKMRHGMIIRLEDYRSAPASMKRNLMADLMTIGYLGTIENEKENALIYIFRQREQMLESVIRAKAVGFDSTGAIEDPVFVEDKDIRWAPNNYRRTYRMESYR